MDKSVRTAIGAMLQTAHKLNLPYTFLPNSVMNKALNVFPDVIPPVGKLPYSQYIAIGVGALAVNYKADNIVQLVPLPHEPRHTGLYNQIPFVLRPVAQDLSASERMRFRMRRITNIGGQAYAAYYLRRMDLAATEVKLEYRIVEDGVVTSTVWEPSLNDLSPTRPVVNPGQVLVTGDDYIAATAKTRFQLNAWDISELINVSNVLYDDDSSVTISEVAICSGLDEQVNGDFNGITLVYSESIGVQITDFISTLLPIEFNRAGAGINLDVGSTEPLLALRASIP